jgi:hypothetical protein
VASLLWAMAFRDLGTIAEVKGNTAALPWGTGTWGETAGAVVTALRR